MDKGLHALWIRVFMPCTAGGLLSAGPIVAVEGGGVMQLSEAPGGQGQDMGEATGEPWGGGGQGQGK